ncbi:amidase signature enzyme [Lentithecium fluviatile CBS 122367]|uniref:Amidase signature enzyme n=1 Tax=Lentithecium fluviatile CBS 122367 TaxID=1168545 RepID=A0A6G1J7M6_9PLEO|nr:amidase signature enzyme [Lentithecium fluviatile CBS 122367]
MNLLTADVKTLCALLQSGELSSESLVQLYVSQIHKYNGYLRAVLYIAPEQDVLQRAKALDKERAEGRVRGPLHGIPILLKDNIATHPDFGMPTSAGNTAFLESRPSKNAAVVDMLLAAGMLVIGKTNLSELSSFKKVSGRSCRTEELTNFRAMNMPGGWSAVGGQTQSAYVRGGFQVDDSRDGHSSPSGSSSGSAVAVSAGFTPLALGTETIGSIMFPSGRAALYSMKPTSALVSLDGIVPVSHNLDSAGPMAKSPYDLALLLDAVVVRRHEEEGAESYTKAMTDSWSEISVGTLDPEKWALPPSMLKPIAEATVQINKEIKAAYTRLESLAKSVKHSVPLPSPGVFVLKGKSSEMMVQLTDFPDDLKNYVDSLETTPIRTLEELIIWNEEHAEEELPPYAPNQDSLLRARDLELSKEEYGQHLEHLRSMARDEGVEKILKEYEVDIIMGPCDSPLPLFAACGGYPVISLPLGYLDYNGRPFGLIALGPRHDEALLIKVASAWEATFGPRQLPDLEGIRDGHTQ